MLTRGKMPKTITFTCDGCSSEFLETDEYDLRVASRIAREAGWATVQIKDEYERTGAEYLHHCPGCARRLGTD